MVWSNGHKGIWAKAGIDDLLEVFSNITDSVALVLSPHWLCLPALGQGGRQGRQGGQEPILGWPSAAWHRQHGSTQLWEAPQAAAELG